jgi:hypothetical protein
MNEFMIRPIEHSDAEICGKIGYEAHKTISSTHGYPSEQPSEDYAVAFLSEVEGNRGINAVE